MKLTLGVLSIVSLALSLIAIALTVDNSRNPYVVSGWPSTESCGDSTLGSQNQRPPVTGNTSFQSERSHFTFSTDRKLVAFVKDVFEEYGNDWKMYWALNIFNPETKEERVLVVDDTRMSSYEWIDNEIIRVYHNAGAGVRVYIDVSVNRDSPLFTKDYEGPDIWTPDAEHSRKARDNMEARRVYFGEEK